MCERTHLAYDKEQTHTFAGFKLVASPRDTREKRGDGSWKPTVHKSRSQQRHVKSRRSHSRFMRGVLGLAGVAATVAALGAPAGAAVNKTPGQSSYGVAYISNCTVYVGDRALVPAYAEGDTEVDCSSSHTVEILHRTVQMEWIRMGRGRVLAIHQQHECWVWNIRRKPDGLLRFHRKDLLVHAQLCLRGRRRLAFMDGPRSGL